MGSKTPLTLCRRLAIAALCAAATAAATAASDEFPSKPVQLVVPSTPGTTGDQIARLLGPALSQRWKAAVVVDNRVGAGGAIGIDAVAKAPADGHTLLFSATAFSTLPALRPQLPFDPLKNFTPVVLLGTSPLVLVVTNSLPVTTVREFIDYVKKQPPGRLNYASPGAGSVHHLTMEMFKQQTGLFLTHIPYRGTAGALNDLAAGHVQVSVVVLQSALALVQSGRMRMIAVMGPQRVAQFPNVPTLRESGVPNVVAEAWFGVTAPAGTPPAVVARINADINALLAQADVRDAMARMGVDAVGGKPEKLDALVRSELTMWEQIVKKGKISGE